MPRPPWCVLFLCTGNSCRSQMAEGWTRHLHGATIEVFSAGTMAHGLNPLAVQVMGEAGVDISGHHSKTLDELPDKPFDLVVTVCSAADAACPAFPGAKRRIHQPFDDPPALARNAKTCDEALMIYRRVREEIRAWVLTLPDWLEAG
ncbi:MAG: arsenate reductase ArsC [Candidatus Sumerlaeaceae bacterium]|nr:arsenate reductase ArsC [Candidatus Sumerlaeaceae bacterium]